MLQIISKKTMKDDFWENVHLNLILICAAKQECNSAAYLFTYYSHSFHWAGNVLTVCKGQC